MSAEELGCAVNDEIGAEFQRLLIDRRGQCVVYNHQRTLAMGCDSQTAEIDHFDGRVGWTLEIDGLACFRDGGFYRFVIVGFTEHHVDAEAWQKLDKDFIRSAVSLLETTRSPGDRSAKSVLLIAAIPLEKLVAA